MDVNRTGPLDLAKAQQTQLQPPNETAATATTTAKVAATPTRQATDQLALAKPGATSELKLQAPAAAAPSQPSAQSPQAPKNPSPDAVDLTDVTASPGMATSQGSGTWGTSWSSVPNTGWGH